MCEHCSNTFCRDLDLSKHGYCCLCNPYTAFLDRCAGCVRWQDSRSIRYGDVDLGENIWERKDIGVVGTKVWTCRQCGLVVALRFVDGKWVMGIDPTVDMKEKHMSHIRELFYSSYDMDDPGSDEGGEDEVILE